MIETSHLVFIETKPDKPRKTRVFEVYPKFNPHPLAILGVIKWYSQWRKYCFFPNANTLFDETCLENIVGFIEKLMFERKETA